jgi:hypothetical protein
MDFRSAGIIATLLIGLEGPGCQAFAQYYPPQILCVPKIRFCNIGDEDHREQVAM